MNDPLLYALNSGYGPTITYLMNINSKHITAALWPLSEANNSIIYIHLGV